MATVFNFPDVTERAWKLFENEVISAATQNIPQATEEQIEAALVFTKRIFEGRGRAQHRYPLQLDTEGLELSMKQEDLLNREFQRVGQEVTGFMQMEFAKTLAAVFTNYLIDLVEYPA